MKYLTWSLGLVVGVVAIIYVVAFTSVGNGILKPTIEGKIKELTKLDAKLKEFSLNMSEFEVILDLNTNNTVHILGNYSLFSQAFNIAYKVKLENLNTLKPLTSSQLNGSFFTDGKVVGDMSFMKVDGKSDVGKSDTTYHIELRDLNPTSIIANIKDASLESLLYLGDQKKYASAKINLDINVKNITPHNLDGDIKLTTLDGKINTKVMKNDFNLTIPKTNFVMNLDAKLKGDDVNYDYKLSSNLFSESSSGKVTPEPFEIDAIYDANIKELALLKPIIGADIRGSFKLDGTIKGKKEKLVVDGKTNLASSNTKFEAILKNFEPSSVSANIKDLKLQKLLYMIKQPHYTDGLFSLNVNISDLSKGNLKGKITSTIKKGLLDSKYLGKTYKFESKMPKTTYDMITNTRLDGDIIDSKVDFNSNLVNLDVKSAKFNLKDSSLKSEYIAKIHDLDKLYFVTNQHLKGKITANGEVKKAKDLDLSFYTKVADGKIEAKLHNDDLNAQLVGIQTMGLLKMLIYPEVFKSTFNANVKYNLAKSAGKLNGHLVDGKFTNNQIFTLIKKYAKFDMYKEKFTGDISADINKDDVLLSLDLKSRKASFKTKGTKLNTKTQVVDSKIDIVANNNPISATVKGNINHPKVKVDVNKIIEKEAGKQIKKLFKKFF